MASTWLGSGSGGWGFGRRVVDPDQARREAEAIAIAPDPWPEFAGPVVYVGSSECEVVPNLSEFSIEVHLEPTSEPLSVFYEFRTEAEEGFGMSGAGVKGNMGFRVDLVNVIREELMVLLEPRVYQSHLQVVRGECKLPKLKGPCRLQLIFDNTHSMMKEKRLSYKVAVIHHRHVADRTVELFSPESSPPAAAADYSAFYSADAASVVAAAPAAAAPAAAPAPAPPPTAGRAEAAVDPETIRAFYAEHAAEKSEEDVQAVLERYDGREAKLLRMLRKKYIEKPAAAAAAAQAPAPAPAPASAALDVSEPLEAPTSVTAAPAPYVAEETVVEEAEGEWM